MTASTSDPKKLFYFVLFDSKFIKIAELRDESKLDDSVEQLKKKTVRHFSTTIFVQ